MPKKNASRVDVCYELLRPDQIVKRRRAAPLAYLPLGTIEWHGPHNPVGLDGLTAHELCVRAAVLGGGLVFPAVWYGENRETHLAEANRPISAAVAKAMGLRANSFSAGYMGGGSPLDHMLFYQALLWRAYHQIRSLGFTAIYVLVGHGPLKLPAQLIGLLFERSTGVRVSASFASDLVEGYGQDHAARYETGVMMELRPELVDLRKITGRPRSKLVGIDGADPSKGSAETGRRFVSLCAPRLAQEGQKLLRREAADGRMAVTS